ncbi:MAG: UDP-hydrolyzing UDP-N-acetyl-D-glucosamine 2-epimerase [Brevundimonas sp.]|jgi:UDP-hydrolysing UDP-N-acetyl-D-glucosamine 2-epimerase|uniref:UDP-N-acetylglucosamine 2-epimerase n=1 Tax=Brevundimonas sp. TaxID=1871086 RepID=UPI0039E5262A
MTRTVCVVSVSRADRAMAAVVGPALDEAGVSAWAMVVDDPLGPDSLIEDHGVRTRRIPAHMDGDGPADPGRRMGALTAAFAEVLADELPDMVVLTGDRYETLAAAGAASLAGVVIAHLHGGELTLGAMDDAFRHAITKLAHLHFPATESAAARLVRMGEEDWRITLAGAPGLDLLMSAPPMPRVDFFSALNITDPGDFILATWHPETLTADGGAAGLEALLKALSDAARPVLFTGVNSDPGGAGQAAYIRRWAEEQTSVHLIPSLGALYAPALAHAAVMAGNSSSGIIEAAAFALPVVNVGDRQKGRDRGANVVDAPADPAAVRQALSRALDPAFRASLTAMINPYGDGRAGPRIAARLAAEPIDARLRQKSFPEERPS